MSSNLLEAIEQLKQEKIPSPQSLQALATKIQSKENQTSLMKMLGQKGLQRIWQLMLCEITNIRKMSAQILCLLTFRNEEIIQLMCNIFDYTQVNNKICLNMVPDIVSRMLQKDPSLLIKIRNIKQESKQIYWCFPPLNSNEDFPDPLFYMIGIFVEASSSSKQQSSVNSLASKKNYIETTASYIDTSQTTHKTVQYENESLNVNANNSKVMYNNYTQNMKNVVQPDPPSPFETEEVQPRPTGKRIAASKDMRKSWHIQATNSMNSHDSSRHEKSQERSSTNKTQSSIEQSIQRIRGALIKAKTNQEQRSKKNSQVQKVPVYKKEAYEQIFQKRKEIYDKMRLSLMSPMNNKINMVKTPSPAFKDKKKPSFSERIKQQLEQKQ